ncbi:MAG: sensor domain-containing diguanylate cyclase [Solirubrobacterales bacterium]|nr:GGDEF domain-containing protein [Solirubrobacterales bacterium]
MNTTSADQSTSTLQELVDVISELEGASDRGELQRIVCRAARRITEADGAAYIVRDGKQCHYAEEDSEAPLWKGSFFPMGECISGWTMVYRQAVAVSDIVLDDRLRPQMYEPTYVQSMAMVPIRSTAPVGAIGVYWDRTHIPSKAQLSGLQALADATAVALENASLNAYVLIDSLSGLYNRRGFFARGAERVTANSECNLGTSLAFASLEGIQQFNDENGYEAGDDAIRRTGVALQSACASDAVIGRIAGNVFAVCGSETSLPTENADELERMVAETMPGSTEQLGLTIGVASAPAGAAVDLDGLVATANRAMYERRHGRPPSVENQIARSSSRH